MATDKERHHPAARVADIDVGGIVVTTNCIAGVDVEGMRRLVENGVPIAEVARHFKVRRMHVQNLARENKWLTPRVVRQMRKELEKHQREVLRTTGGVADIADVKARIWDERGERLNERVFELVEQALEGVSEEKAKRLIQNPKGLLEIVDAGRKVTGLEKKDLQEVPRLAVNLQLLRAGRPIPISFQGVRESSASSVVDVEPVE